MPAHIGSSSPNAHGRSYNNPRTGNPSKIVLAAIGISSIVFAVYVAESYPKRKAHTQPRVYQDALTYDMYALEPYVSSETMDYHYNKHDYGYDKKLQTLVNNTDLVGLSLMEIIERNASGSLPAGVYNNAGQLLNHNIFWASMTSVKTSRYPTGMSVDLKKKLEKDFGSVESFLKDFSQKAVNWFGSGWTYVVLNRRSGSIEIVNTANGNYLNPPGDYQPLFNLDVWEHAYYIDYRNRRDEYVKAFLNVVNWDFASSQFASSP
jgi:Fe-Mn family superoxide dismutase